MPLVYATTASGKSTFVTEYDHYMVVDGDDIVENTIGWPSGQWWRNMSDEDIEDFHKQAYDAMLPHAKVSWVLTGLGGINPDTIRRLRLEGVPVYFWDVPEAIIRRNVKSRQTAKADNKLSGNGPDDLDEIIDIHRYNRGIARSMGMIIVSYDRLETLVSKWLEGPVPKRMKSLVIYEYGDRISGILSWNGMIVKVIPSRGLVLISDQEFWFPDDARILDRFHVGYDGIAQEMVELFFRFRRRLSVSLKTN